MCALLSGSADLSCQIAGIRLPSPFVLASGIWGTSPALLERAARTGAGAVTAKTCTPRPRRGHKNPTAIDWGHGLINAMGLPNPGVTQELALLQEASRRLRPLKVALIASISADTADDFAQSASIITRSGPDMIELNISCPNLGAEHGEMFAASPAAAAEVTARVKAVTSLPCLVKLSPNVHDIGEIARAVVDAGADAITAINTMPGMLIDAGAGLPVLANGTGGISGPALKPIALRCVYDIASVVSVPIVGTGGVLTGVDTVEMILAGATAVGVGSAVFYRGDQTFSLIREELSAWLTAHDHGCLDQIRGTVHRGRSDTIMTAPPPFPDWERNDG
ncbi:MAG TPA: dihydroorotate dehydrogenase [Spirochaetia bacterium]|nr:dihydroorotate dehydrogenase [Spirochaetia bacterium]